jgi:hypothetical protein
VRKRRKKKLTAKNVALPVAVLILLTFSCLAVVSVLYSNGSITIPGIGTIIVTNPSSGSNSSGSGYIPVGQLSFSMQLIANYADKANITISTVGNFPSLDVIQVHNRTVKQVFSRALVAFVAANPLPAGSTANFVINYTILNLHSYYTTWRIYRLQVPFLNGTTALVMLPDFPITGQQVYSDVCNQLSNGTLNCNGFQHAGSLTRRVQWSIAASLNVTTPLSLIPQKYSSSIVSSADFDAQGSFKSCNNCNAAPVISGVTLHPTSAHIEPKTPKPTTVTPPGISTVTTVTSSGALLATACGAACPVKTVTTSGGKSVTGGGTVTGHTALGAALAARHNANLLPIDYTSFALGGGWIFASPLLLLLAIVGFAGVVSAAVFLVLRLWRW